MITYNNMIQKLDTQHFSCFVNAARHPDILRTWSRIAAGMIVYQYQVHCMNLQSLQENLPGGNRSRVHSSPEQLFFRQNPVPGI